MTEKLENTKKEKLCVDCARPIPAEARRCIHNNCGTYQDWRRYLGSQFNVLSIVTLFGIIVTIVANMYQIHDMAQMADKEDVQKIEENLFEALTSYKDELLAAPDEYTNRYRNFLQAPNTGIVRLFPRGENEELEAILPGGGAYYSFIRRTSEYGYGSDIAFVYGGFHVGFAGADYGFFMQLGDIPIQDLSSVSENPPNWLEIQKHDAWLHMWTYSPPPELANLRLEARAYNEGVMVGSVTLSEEVAAAEQTTYLLRSLSIGQSDILVAFRAEEQLDDGSFILVWRILKIFDTPVGIGPDLQE